MEFIPSLRPVCQNPRGPFSLPACSGTGERIPHGNLTSHYPPQARGLQKLIPLWNPRAQNQLLLVNEHPDPALGRGSLRRCWETTRGTALLLVLKVF